VSLSLPKHQHTACWAASGGILSHASSWLRGNKQHIEDCFKEIVHPKFCHCLLNHMYFLSLESAVNHYDWITSQQVMSTGFMNESFRKVSWTDSLERSVNDLFTHYYFLNECTKINFGLFCTQNWDFMNL